MKARIALQLLSLGLLAATLAGCSKQDGSVILGQWHAERLDLMGLKLPIAPDLAISRDKLSMQGQDLPITQIEQDGDEVVIDTAGGIGLTWHVVDEDRIYVKFPLLDRIYYRRVKAAPAASPAVAAAPASAPAPAPAPAPVLVAAAVPATPQPLVKEQPVVAAYAQAYDAAVQASRQGQGDAALRYLHQAVQQGFHGTDVLQREPAFAALQEDPRYQVIVLNMAKSGEVTGSAASR